MALVIRTKRILKKEISEWENVHGMKSGGNQTQASKIFFFFFPRAVTQYIGNSSTRIVTTHVKCHPSGKLIKDSMPRVCFGGWSRGHPLSSKYPDSRSSEGKQMFSINHIVYTNSLGRESPQQLGRWELFQYPGSQTLVKGQLYKQFFLRRAVPGLLC